ncbi:YraN family protein [Legionella yabuuchiae]|uniref:YraN family protein n=1 Tax=Legionella yabuuchiae TaxID=376727 RepID=UPI001054F046|nr:YraN family protein [Legionella yabuuchiae]
MSQQIGFAAEEEAKQYLLSQGLKLIDQNYRSKLGEIDLIMQDNAYLVFIEVRARASNAFGGALASVNYQKQQKLIKTALFYLMQKKLNNKYPVRFDVISLEGKPYQINWIKDAFRADY